MIFRLFRVIKNSESRGNILLLTLLVVSVLVVVGLFISSLVTLSLKQSKTIEDSLSAWYLAEMATENGLYQARKEGNFDNLYFVNNLERIPWEGNGDGGGSSPPSPPGGPPGPGGFEDFCPLLPDIEGGDIARQAVEEEELIIDIATDDYYQVDLYNPGSDPEEKIKSLRLEAETDNGWLVVGWTRWQTTGYVGQAYREELIGPTELTEGNRIINLQETDFGTYYYRVKLKALKGDINSLRITVYNDLSGTEQVNIPARLILNSYGFYGRSSKKIVVTMPRREPLYDLFDYVLFSEETIEK